jgi:hypothetical protein
VPFAFRRRGVIPVCRCAPWILNASSLSSSSVGLSDSEFCPRFPADMRFFGSAQFSEILKATQRFLQDLFTSLERPRGHLKASWQSLSWPSSKGEVKEHIDRLKRVKSWFISAMMTDSLIVAVHYLQILVLTVSHESIQSPIP